MKYNFSAEKNITFIKCLQRMTLNKNYKICSNVMIIFVFIAIKITNISSYALEKLVIQNKPEIHISLF